MKAGGGCDATPYWDGWYISLYLDGETDALDWDALVADVHTSPDQGILHQATGDVDLLVATIERGADAMAFAGPVAEHYEFVEPKGSRLNDKEWRERYRRGRPERAEWMQGWVVAEGRWPERRATSALHGLGRDPELEPLVVGVIRFEPRFVDGHHIEHWADGGETKASLR